LQRGDILRLSHIDSSSSKSEDQLRLITRFELAIKINAELQALLRQVFNTVIYAQPNSLEQVNTIASL